MKQEKWFPVKGFEGFYEVSSFENIRSVDRLAWNGFIWHKKKGRVIKKLIDAYGYYQVRLCKNGISKNKKVHRLVAEVFVKNLDEVQFTHVNHKDCNKLNNAPSNLEWVTFKQNIEHAKCNGRMINNGRYFNSVNNRGRKPVIQMTKEGVFVKEWTHFGAAALSGLISRTTLQRALLGKRQFGNGFIWKYKNGTQDG